MTIFLFSLVLWRGSISQAMEFTKHIAPAGIAIKATGAIEVGDAAKFQSVVPSATVDERGLRRIILESGGGDVSEAVRIALIIRQNNFVTLVGGECASACAMILYPAGRYFMLLDSGKLGFHSCYVRQTGAEDPECTDAIARLAAENGFPYGSVKMVAGLAGPADMYWVTNVLAHCYGMEHFVGDPAPVTVSTLCPSVILALMSGKVGASNSPLGPSFDCKKSNTPVATLLCRDRELVHLDALMGQLYRMMRQREGKGSSQLLVAQQQWIKARDEKCNVSGQTISSFEGSRKAARCISEMTMTRMDDLLIANGTPRQNLSPLLEHINK